MYDWSIYSLNLSKLILRRTVRFYLYIERIDKPSNLVFQNRRRIRKTWERKKKTSQITFLVFDSQTEIYQKYICVFDIKVCINICLTHSHISYPSLLALGNWNPLKPKPMFIKKKKSIKSNKRGICGASFLRWF